MNNPSGQNPVRQSVRSGAGWVQGLQCPRCKRENTPPLDRCSHCGYSFRETCAIDDAPGPEAGALVGQVINNKYRVVSVLGEGGFGVVYKVELLLFDTGNTFALKLLHPSLSQDSSFRRRFLREAALAMELIHENTIQIREFGRTEDGHLFFTMDYCEGEPLNRVIAREGYLTVNRALDVTRQMLAVMRLAHSRGIIHRDLKPENIFLEKRGERRDFVKVGDFGLAKSYGVDADTGTGITRGGILGTPRYMSPEQAMGSEGLDNRSDLYSVGVILYEMLYGSVPEKPGVDGEGAELEEPPPSPGGHVVPQAVWRVVRKAISLARENRYQSADDFLEAIDSLPEYTPTYVEPAAAARGPGAPRWRVPALVITTGVAAAALLSMFYPPPQVAGPGAGASPPEAAEARGVPPPTGAEASQPAETRPDAAPAPTAQERTETLPAAAPSSRAGNGPPWEVESYLPFAAGKTFRYRVEVHRSDGGRDVTDQREITYQITREKEPGVFEVTGPGERPFRWIVDAFENRFVQEFDLPDPEFPDKLNPSKKTLLALPGSPWHENYEAEGLVVHTRLVDFRPEYSQCLLVESRVGTQVQFRYYKRGLGIVGVECFEAVSRGPESAEPEPGLVTASELPGAAPATQTSPGATLYRLVYMRYLLPDSSGQTRGN